MKVSDIMTKRVISVLEDEPMVLAADIMSQYNFKGLPVVDHNNKLVGIVTDYDLISKGYQIHVPTFLKLVKNLPMRNKDNAEIKEEVQKIFSFKVRDVMNNDPLTIGPDASIEEAGKVFSEHHKVNPIPVVDAEKNVVGLLSHSDLLYLYSGRPKESIGEIKRFEYRNVDERMKKLLNNLEKDYALVSKFRSKIWIVIEIVLLLITVILGVMYALGNIRFN